jgi:uncharacterized membrane protein YdjX (TVP38/TMEM64 family)
MSHTPEMETPEGSGKKQTAWRARGIAAGSAMLALLAIGIAGWLQGWFSLFTDLETLREWTLSLGAWAPVATIALNSAQVLLSPIPGHALNIVSGYLFGPWLGTLYTVIGVLCGSIMALWLVRQLGRPFAERLAGRARLERFDALMRRRGPVFLFWIFLFPFFPDDVICLVAGLTPLPIRKILLLALVGRTPGLFVANLIGHTVTELTLWQWVAFGVVIVLLGGIFWRFQEAIESAVTQLAQRLSHPQPSSDDGKQC